MCKEPDHQIIPVIEQHRILAITQVVTGSGVLGRAYLPNTLLALIDGTSESSVKRIREERGISESFVWSVGTACWPGIQYSHDQRHSMPTSR